MAGLLGWSSAVLYFGEFMVSLILPFPHSRRSGHHRLRNCQLPTAGSRWLCGKIRWFLKNTSHPFPGIVPALGKHRRLANRSVLHGLHAVVCDLFTRRHAWNNRRGKRSKSNQTCPKRIQFPSASESSPLPGEILIRKKRPPPAAGANFWTKAAADC